MKKYIYQQPSVTITDITMVQTLCASGTGGKKLGSSVSSGATTDHQL